MKRTLNLTMLLIFAAFLAISIQAAPGGGGSTSPCPADIRALSVRFRDAAGDKYRSDNGLEYKTVKSKGENLEIMFQRANCTYDLTMNLHFSKRTAKITALGTTYNSEFFNFDRVASVPVTQTTNTAFNDFCGPVFGEPNVQLNTGSTNTYRYDNYAGCGFDAGGYYVRRSVGINAGPDHSFRFQNTGINPTGNLGAGTSYIKVYHPNAQTWVLSPEDPSYGVLISNNAIVGHDNVPFAITVSCPTCL